MNHSILFVTGTRADFGKIEPLAQKCVEAGFEVTFFITGMHLLHKYGLTSIEVKKFSGARFFEYINQKIGDPLDLILSKTILGFSDFVSEHKPDLVVIHGDRIETLAASIVCSTRYIRSAHIEGGEISGTIDESIRHCNTKLCTTHFVSSDDAYQRVLLFGESKKRIFNIGSPEIDLHSKPSQISIHEVCEHYNIRSTEFGIVVFHPVTSETNTIGVQAKKLFKSLVSTKRYYVVILPNNDPGSESILEVISSLDSRQFRVIPSMRFNYFSVLMKNAKIMIGNSSAGVREAPFIGLPSIDIGSRQTNRSSSESVHNVSAFEDQKICHLVDSLWGKSYECSQEFGSGNSSSKFIEVINSKSFWEIEMQKNYVQN